jgi:SAM-dependent methyltransferase
MDHRQGDGEEDLALIRRFWDTDAVTYDRSPGHRPRHPAVQQAWATVLAQLLPPPPARVLDCGAGTGFLSLLAARAGYRVTALDFSPAMLERLTESAAAEGLVVETVLGPAEAVPAGHFDAVMERHLVWTLPDPIATLRAWHEAADRLVLVEGVWGADAPAVERWRASVRRRLRQLRKIPPDHHGEYSEELRRSLPFGSGTPPARLHQAVLSAGWPNAEIRWLRDLGRAERRALPYPERLVGVTPRFAVTAG